MTRRSLILGKVSVIILCLFLGVTSFAKPEKKKILFIDLNNPFEVDTWISVLGLSKDKCGTTGADICNDEFLGYRPLRTANHVVISEWLKETSIKPDAIFISGHHSNGFFGSQGDLSFQTVHALAEGNPISDVFINPRLVYLGGCYTTQSKFTEQERDPVSYLTRVTSHNEVPRVDLMVSAIQQIAHGGEPNPWQPYFPNATLLGYDKRGPGDNSEANIKVLITKFASHVRNQEQAPTFSMALYRIISESVQKNSNASGLAFSNLGKWWTYDGHELSETNSAAFVPEKYLKITKLKLGEGPNIGNSSYAVLTNILKAILMGDETVAPWLSRVDTTARAQMVVDISSMLSYVSMDEDLENLIQEAALTTLQTSTSNELMDAAIEILLSGQISDDLAERIFPWLTSEDSRKRSAGLFILDRLVNYSISDDLKEKIVAALKPLLNDPNPSIRSSTIWTISGTSDTHPEASQGLLDTNPKVREESALFFIEKASNDAETQLRLVTLLKDKFGQTAHYAADSLQSSEISDPKVIRELIKVFQLMNQPTSQLAALEVLKGRSEKDPAVRAVLTRQLFVEPNPFVKVRIIEALPRTGADIKEALIKELDSNSVDVRGASIHALLSLDDLLNLRGLEDKIITRLSDVPKVRIEALKGLNRFLNADRNWIVRGLFSRELKPEVRPSEKLRWTVARLIGDRDFDTALTAKMDLQDSGGPDESMIGLLLTYSASSIPHVREYSLDTFSRMRPLPPSVQLAAIQAFTDSDKGIQSTGYSLLFEALADEKHPTQLVSLAKQKLKALIKQNNKLAIELSKYRRFDWAAN